MKHTGLLPYLTENIDNMQELLRYDFVWCNVVLCKVSVTAQDHYSFCLDVVCVFYEGLYRKL